MVNLSNFFSKIKKIYKSENYSDSQETTEINENEASVDFIECFKDLNHTLLSNEMLFLVNDNNNEIRQHYDKAYIGKIDYEKFIKSQKSKEDFFLNKNMTYNFFIVPDKSILQRNKLPFKTNNPIRHVDNLHEVVNDLLEILDENDSDITDTHVSRKAGIKIFSYILQKVHNEHDMNYYLELLNSKIKVCTTSKYKGDLMSNKNWSYGEGELKDKYYYVPTEFLELKDEYIDFSDKIPLPYKTCGERASVYYKNMNSISDKKLLLFTDSHGDRIIPACIAYYREVFAYWDHWYFNKDLVKWFKPDDVVEFRTERFLDNPLCPLISEDTEIPIPIITNNIKIYVENNLLIIDAPLIDYHKVPIDAKCNVYLNNDLIDSKQINGKYLLKYNLPVNISSLNVSFLVKTNPKIKDIEITKKIEL